MNSSILFGNMRKNLTGQFQMETLDKATKARLEAAVLQRDLIPFFPPPPIVSDLHLQDGQWRRLWQLAARRETMRTMNSSAVYPAC